MPDCFLVSMRIGNVNLPKAAGFNFIFPGLFMAEKKYLNTSLTGPRETFD